MNRRGDPQGPGSGSAGGMSQACPWRPLTTAQGWLVTSRFLQLLELGPLEQRREGVRQTW